MRFLIEPGLWLPRLLANKMSNVSMVLELSKISMARRARVVLK